MSSPTYTAYKKSTDYVEVYFFDGSKESVDLIVQTLSGKEINHTVTESHINVIGKGKHYLRHIEIKQDNNIYTLYKGCYMVLDNLHTVTTYTEARFRKLFERVYPNIY